MFDKLDNVLEKFRELEHSLSQPDLSGKELTRLSKERALIEDVCNEYNHYKSLKLQYTEAQTLLYDEKDEGLKAMAKEEMDRLEEEIEQSSKKLTLLLLPQDPNDKKNVIIEVRAGTGGDEAALFAGDLFRMYQRFADDKGWRHEVLSASPGTTGGFKEIICLISGQGVFSQLKFESGTHRVQRVPVTEAQGRIHTSACTVAVMPEADDVEVQVDARDLEITATKSSGAGGQHVNTTDSAVRIVHIPSGMVVECQEERSQIKNRERALKVLKARLLEKAQREQDEAISASRKSQVGSGDRSERIRTYNFPQGRVTDHRIQLTLYKLSEFMEGDISEMVDALINNHQAQLMQDS